MVSLLCLTVLVTQGSSARFESSRILNRLLGAHTSRDHTGGFSSVLTGDGLGHVSTPPTNAAMASLSTKFRGKKPPMRESPLGLPPSPPLRDTAVHGFARSCPEPLGSTVNATGLLPVDWFRNAMNVSCDQAVRLAMNMSRDHCGGVLYFDTPCGFESTVEVIGGMGFQGSANGEDEFSTQPQTTITGPDSGPAFSVQHVDQVHFNDLAIIGVFTGVYITDAALIRFTNVAIHATTQGTGLDNVNLTAAGCNGCNVVLGSNNTALVIENSFWIWAEDCSFYFYPLYAAGPPAYSLPPAHENDWGQRPSVIIRGNHPSLDQGISTVYLLHFDRIVISGGGFQYQQVGKFPSHHRTAHSQRSPLLLFAGGKRRPMAWVFRLQLGDLRTLGVASLRCPSCQWPQVFLGGPSSHNCRLLRRGSDRPTLYAPIPSADRRLSRVRRPERAVCGAGWQCGFELFECTWLSAEWANDDCRLGLGRCWSTVPCR